MSVRYAAGCKDSKGMRFRCYVTLDPEGWYASIHRIDSRTNKPNEIFGEFVDGPDAGKAITAKIMPQFLKANNLPDHPLTWTEYDY
jgi:hypothetical protein